MNVAAARLAREAADAAERAQPDRPRFVAGSLGPDQPDRVDEPGRQRPRGAQRHLARSSRPPTARPAAGLVEGGADILLDRDDLRHAQREGRDLRGRGAVRRARRSALPLIISRDDRRRLRADPVGPDRRGVLAQHPPRRSADRRAQLRARAEAAARASRTSCRGSPTVPISAYPNAGLPNELGGYDETPEEMAERARRVGAARPAQRRRQLLRVDARRTSPRSPRRSRACRRARSRSRAGTTRLSGLEPLDHPAARQRVRQRRRADERHRLAQVRPARRRRRARTRRSTSPASRSPTAPSSST